MNIRTIHPALRELLVGAPVLRYSYVVQDSPYACYDSRRGDHLQREMRYRAARELGEAAIERATTTTEYDQLTLGSRFEARVVVMSEAEPAVLLTRAHLAR